MSAVLKRIEETREALVGALANRDWEAVGELDQACRLCMDEVMSAEVVDEEALRDNLQDLLGVYRQLIDVATEERQAIADEMSKIKQAQQATKVYHLYR
ncbi:MAG TPA: flagellar protein FliT [Pseudomonas sp.]|nr:flagellar protein FliT [Pseudomonas sp.]